MNLVASKLIFNDKVMPFLIAGVSDGDASLFKKDVARESDLASIPLKARLVMF